MATDFNSQLTTQMQSENKLNASDGQVARFCYEQQAFTDDEVAGTATYNYQNKQNIPLGTDTILQMSSTILNKGLRSQASSFTRMAVNHFFGRSSYNINKLAKHLYDLMLKFKTFMNEGDNAWTATTLYKVDDIVYMMSTLNYKPCKRTFVCILDCPDVNYPPLYTDGSLINTSYWKEISANFAGMEVNGATTLNGDLTVNGNITQSGTTYVTHAEQIYTKKDNIITREDASAGLASGKYSGIKVTNYDGNGTDGVLAYRSDGTAVVGDYTEGTPPTENLQPLLTRSEENQLTSGAPFIWDGVNKRAVSGSLAGTNVISTATTSVTSLPLSDNMPVSIMFTANIADTNPTGGVTPLTISYNGTSIPVKATKAGSLIPIYAKEIQTNIFRYLDAWTILDLVYVLDDVGDGTGNPAFIVIGNPIVLSSSDYTIYANGYTKDGNPIGTWVAFADDNDRKCYLKAGTTFNQSDYPALYTMLGTNVVPDKGYDLDWNNAEAITISTTDYVVQKNGWVIVSIYNGNTESRLYINGKRIATTFNYAYAQVQVEVVKGDVINTSTNIDGQFSYFVPYLHPMFIKATNEWK